jgi:hypothetical protein
MIINMMK